MTHYRETTLDELWSNADLLTHLWDHLTDGKEDSDMRYLLRRDPSLPMFSKVVILATQGETVVGWAALYAAGRRRGYADVFVHPDQRQQGIGTKLVKDLKAAFLRDGLCRLCVGDVPVFRATLGEPTRVDSEHDHLVWYEGSTLASPRVVQ